MKKKELYDLRNLLDSFRDKKSTKFAHALMRNLNKINSELKKVDELQQPKPELKRFQLEMERARMTVLEEIADKDNKGNTIFVNDKNEIVDKSVPGSSFRLTEEAKKVFVEKMEEASKVKREEFKEFFDKEEANKKIINDLLQEDSDIELYKVKEEFLPDDLSANELEGLASIIM